MIDCEDPDLKKERFQTYKNIVETFKESEKSRMGYPESLMGILYKSLNEDGKLEFSFEGNLDQKVVDNTPFEANPGSFIEYTTLQIGDPWKDSDSCLTINQQEKEVIGVFSRYLGENLLKGYITSGGTEGNLISLYWSKKYLISMNEKKIEDLKKSIEDEQSELDYLRKSKLLNDLSKPIVYFTRIHTHYSLYKICNILSLDYIEVEGLDSGQMDINDFELKIKNHVKKYPNRYIIISSNVGTTIYGAIDDIPAIHRLLKRHCDDSNIKYSIHADGASLGMLLPILKPFGDVDNYFSAIGVNTLAISGHKFLGLPVSGVALVNKNFLDLAYYGSGHIEYCGNIKDNTLTGCRLMINVLMFHNMLHSIGLDRKNDFIEEIVSTNLRNAKYAYEKLCKLQGKENVYWNSNQFNIIFKRPSDDVIKKYRMMIVDKEKACIAVLQHFNKDKIEKLIEVLIDDKQHK